MSEQLVSDWLAWMASGSTAPSTIRSRGYTVRAFAREHPLATATHDDVQEYLGRPCRGPEGRKTVLASLRSLYRWAALRDLLDNDPTRLAHPIHVPAGVPKPCPELVLRRGILHADRETTLMLLLGAYAGLRLSEIAALRAGDITPNGLRVTGKGGRTRIVPVHPRLDPYLDFADYAFPSPVRAGHVCSDYVATRVEGALGGGWTTHSLRHRFATCAYRATHDLRSVQQLLGHSSPTTTARYVGVNDDQLAAAVLAVA